MKSLQIFFCLQTDVTLNFVNGLLVSNSFNIILRVIDYLIKKKYYIPCIMNENSTVTETIAQSLLQNVWKLYDLLLQLTSNKSSQLISRIQKYLYKIFDISIDLSISFYLKTDSLNEIAN